MNTLHKQNGYIALTTVIIVSLILLVIGAGISNNSFFSRSGYTDAIIKEQAYFLAYSCIDIGYYRAQDNLDYQGNETIQIDSDSCKIDTTVLVGTQTTITTHASVSSEFTNLKTVLDAEMDMSTFKEQ